MSDVVGAVPFAVIHFKLGLHGWQQGRISEGKFEPRTKALVQNLRAAAPRANPIRGPAQFVVSAEAIVCANTRAIAARVVLNYFRNDLPSAMLPMLCPLLVLLLTLVATMPLA